MELGTNGSNVGMCLVVTVAEPMEQVHVQEIACDEINCSMCDVKCTDHVSIEWFSY